QVSAPAQLELARALGVVDELCGKRGRGPEAERIPAFRAGQDEGGAIEERAHHRFVGRRHHAEASLLRGGEESVGERLQPALLREPPRETGRIRCPACKVPRPVDPAGRQCRWCRWHVINLPEKTYTVR